MVCMAEMVGLGLGRGFGSESGSSLGSRVGFGFSIRLHARTSTFLSIDWVQSEVGSGYQDRVERNRAEW